jgi:hypothetical protein
MVDLAARQGEETEMVANVSKGQERGAELSARTLVFSLARGLLRIGPVQTSMGQKSKDSSNEALRALKPLADFSVYTFATLKTR